MARALLHLWLLVLPAAAQEPDPALVAFAERFVGEHHHALYMGEQKVGWTSTAYSIGEFEGTPAFVIEDRFRAHATFEGEDAGKARRSIVRYALLPGGAWLGTSRTEREDGIDTSLEARPDGDELWIRRKVGERRSERRVPLPDVDLGDKLAMQAWLESVPKRGATREEVKLDLDADDGRGSTRVTFLGREMRARGGAEVPVYRVSVVSDGFEMQCELYSHFEMLSGTSGFVEVRLEPKDRALDLSAPPADLLRIAHVPVEAREGKLFGRRMVVELTGVAEGTSLPETDWQRVLSRGEKTVLEILGEPRREEARPLGAEDRARFTQATHRITSEDPEVRKLAERVGGRSKRVKTRAGRLARWTYENLRKTYAKDAPTALAVLDHGAGDCTEHALLFVALARALDIPAREVSGLVLSETRTVGRAFVWHAWAEVHDGEGWVPVDPAFGQYPADAMHILFTEDIDDLTWTRSGGRLRARITEGR